MCGIAAYLGNKFNVQDVLLSILEKLEYRGYDSAGVAYMDKSGKIIYKRKLGELSKLKSALPKTTKIKGGVGIGHTRWATHGKPSVKNAHPHNVGQLFLVHNGIIENYNELKDELLSKGYKLNSDTDTELVLLLIYDLAKSRPVKEAFKLALDKIKGAYALVLFDSSNPDELYAAKLSSPLALGISDDNEYFIASDSLAFSDFAKRVVYLSDFELLHLTRLNYSIENFKKNKKVSAKEEKIEYSGGAASKAGFKTYMEKEIYEQPDSIKSSIQGRIDKENKKAVLGGLLDVSDELKQVKEIHFVACGTSYNAALLAQPYFEELLQVPVFVHYASEQRYKLKKLRPQTVAFFISQSGETADTLSALKKYKQKGALCLGVVNTVASSIARLTHAGVYNHAGPEISVASTKAFTSQLAVLLLIASYIKSLQDNTSSKKAWSILKKLHKVPQNIEKVIKDIDKQALNLAKKIKDSKSMYVLARSELYPIAKEAALKIKEISYIHAESYPAGELKHGPIALIDKSFPALFFAQDTALYEKLLSNAEELKSRGADIYAVLTPNMHELKKISKSYIEIPVKDEVDMLFKYALALQFVALHLASLKGLNVDKPKNLAKSVTVE